MNKFGLAFSKVLASLLAIGLGGCATTPTINRIQQSDLKLPIKMLVMEAPLPADPERFSSVLAPEIKKSADSEKLVAEGEKHAEEYALSSMKASLSEQAGIELISNPSNEIQGIKKIQKANLDVGITPNEANRLRKETGADALLRFGITDYGLTPRAWRKGYITFEVTSTLAIAGIIAYSGSTAAKAAAGAYLAQEAAEETVEGYAGFRALDVVSRPVRIEAQLVQLNPLETVWEDSNTGLSDTKLSRLTRKVSDDEKKHQLDQSTDYAIKDLTAGLLAVILKVPRRNNQ